VSCLAEARPSKNPGLECEYTLDMGMLHYFTNS
jgi:hypothetical protein